MLIGYKGDTPFLEEDAKGVLSLLWATYPGHPWCVWCMKGYIFIKYLGFDSPYGMGLKVTEADHDAAVMKKKIVMLAGEWLERAGLKRGRSEDEDIQKVEGVPEKYQPKTEPVKFLTGDEHLRSEPMPQVVNGR